MRMTASVSVPLYKHSQNVRTDLEISLVLNIPLSDEPNICLVTRAPGSISDSIKYPPFEETMGSLKLTRVHVPTLVRCVSLEREKPKPRHITVS